MRFCFFGRLGAEVKRETKLLVFELERVIVLWEKPTMTSIFLDQIGGACANFKVFTPCLRLRDPQLLF